MKRYMHAVFLVSAMLTAPAWAQFAKPESAVEYRQSAFTLIGNHMARIKVQLDAGKANPEAIRASVAVIDALKALPFEAFTPGTADIGDSSAKPEIWTDRDKFDKLAKEMQDKVTQLATVARGTDTNAIRAAFGDLGKSCKNCHDDFRKKR